MGCIHPTAGRLTGTRLSPDLPPFAMTLRLLLALALLPLAACGDADDATVADSDVDVVTIDPIDEPVMNDTLATDDLVTDDAAMDSGVTAEATLDAVSAAGGLTSLTPDAAVQNIDAWIVRLSNLDDVPVALIQSLQALKGQLNATPLDGAAIGATLVELGTGTQAAAAGDGSLEQLGEALEAAGNQLQGL